MSLDGIFDPVVMAYFGGGNSGGGEADHSMEDGLIDGTITEYRNDRVESVADYAFYKNQDLTRITLPNVKTVGAYAFYDAKELKIVDLAVATSIGDYALGEKDWLPHVVLRSETMVDLTTRGFGDDDKIIYVPRALVSGYENQCKHPITHAIMYSYSIKALEDYTVDGTITGELDLTKMGL